MYFIYPTLKFPTSGMTKLRTTATSHPMVLSHNKRASHSKSTRDADQKKPNHLIKPIPNINEPRIRPMYHNRELEKKRKR